LAPGFSPPGAFFVRAYGHDKGMSTAYIRLVRTLLLIVSLFGLLALALWFAGTAWVRLGGEPMPAYGYIAIAGGVLFSLLIGGGLMALVFYSSRHGYDEGKGEP
jgi:O-antigen/teichoic acid export membrane protein